MLPVSRGKRLAMAGVAVGVLAVGSAYALAFRAAGAGGVAPWLMIAGTSLCLAATLALGAYRPGVNGRRIVLLVVFLVAVLVCGFGAALLLPAEDASGPLLLGLPRRAGLLILGIGLLPIAVLPFAYARDFIDRGLDEAALERFRREARRLQEEHGIDRSGGRH